MGAANPEEEIFNAKLLEAFNKENVEIYTNLEYLGEDRNIKSEIDAMVIDRSNKIAIMFELKGTESSDHWFVFKGAYTKLYEHMKYIGINRGIIVDKHRKSIAIGVDYNIFMIEVVYSRGKANGSNIEVLSTDNYIRVGEISKEQEQRLVFKPIVVQLSAMLSILEYSRQYNIDPYTFYKAIESIYKCNRTVEYGCALEMAYRVMTSGQYKRDSAYLFIIDLNAVGINIHNHKFTPNKSAYILCELELDNRYLTKHGYNTIFSREYTIKFLEELFIEYVAINRSKAIVNSHKLYFNRYNDIKYRGVLIFNGYVQTLSSNGIIEFITRLVECNK